MLWCPPVWRPTTADLLDSAQSSERVSLLELVPPRRKLDLCTESELTCMLGSFVASLSQVPSVTNCSRSANRTSPNRALRNKCRNARDRAWMSASAFPGGG